ncbi:MAG: hypothetical protein QM706_04180 [Nitrospira sp.]
MACGRCGGLMVMEAAYNVGLAISGQLQEIRCINCGNVEDPVIWTHRLPSIAERSRVPSRK